MLDGHRQDGLIDGDFFGGDLANVDFRDPGRDRFLLDGLAAELDGLILLEDAPRVKEVWLSLNFRSGESSAAGGRK